jgi:hypothetical protein
MDIDQGYLDIAYQLQQAGIAAGQGVNDANPKADHLAIGRPGTKVWEEWKLFEYRGGCLTGHPYKNSWIPTVPILPIPPTDDYGCPATRPERLWTAATLPPGWGEDAIGTPRWKLGSSAHGKWIDTTANVIRNQPYCEAIGMGTHGGQSRAACPVRPEGHPDRVACERYLAEGDWTLFAKGGATCMANPENSAQFYPNNGNCQLCNPARTVCTAWY